MTADFLLQYIPRRMLVWKLPDHRIVHRTMLVEPWAEETLLLDGRYAWFPAESITPVMEVRSDCGILSSKAGNPVMEYEHTGRTVLKNNSPVTVAFHFLLAIAGPPQLN